MDYAFVLKLTLTPLFIGLISGYARRFGPRAAGWLAGLPLTSGPISVFIALEQGPVFAAQAAPATILGIFPVALFCLVWSRLARKGFRIAYGSALIGYLALLPLVITVPPQPVIALAVTVLALMVALLLAPRVPRPRAGAASPAWDIPLRMTVATLLVVTLTGIAHILGPQWTGMLSPFPVFASVLAAFHQRHDGPDAAVLVLRGILTGVLSFCAFFFVVGVMLPAFSLWSTYLVASACAVVLNGINGLLLRRSMPMGETPTEP